MKKLLSFEHNGYKLIVFLQDKNFLFAKEEKKNITFELTEEEKNLINEVMSKVFPTKKLVNLGNISYKKREFKHFFDKVNGFHLFYLKDGSMPTVSDFIALNKKYNQETFCFKKNPFDYLDIESDFKDEPYETKEEIERYIEINGKLKKVVVFLLTLFISISLGITYKLNEDKILSLKRSIFTKSYSFSDVVSLIQNNPRIGEAEKRIFLSCPEYIESCLPYFNDILYENLKDMTISYVSSKCEYSDTVAGNHNIDTKEIQIFSSTSLNSGNENVVTHEYLHVFHERNYNLGMPFYEFLNVVINNEYFGNDEIQSGLSYDEGYTWLYEFGYIMLELFDTDTLRSYHANPDYHILIDKLVEIIPDEELAYGLLSDIEEYQSKFKENKNTPLDNDEMKTLKKRIKGTLRKYYEAKFNQSIYNNMNVLYFYEPTLATVEIMEHLGIDKNFLPLMSRSIKVKSYKHFFNGEENDSIVFIVPVQFEETKINISDGLSIDTILDLYQDYYLSYQKTEKGYEITLYSPIYNEKSIEVSASDIGLNFSNPVNQK